jgi:hypothetical protein
MVEGPEHAPTFVTVVLVDGEIVGRGRGATKKAAQQVAAAETLARLFPAVESIALKEGQTFFIANALLTMEAARPKEEELPEMEASPSAPAPLRFRSRVGDSGLEPEQSREEARDEL